MAKKTIQIKNRYTGEVIFECQTESIKEAVEEAVKKNISLYEANLRKADLNGADLNCIFYNTKVTLFQKKYITENTDLFSVVENTSSNSKKLKEQLVK